MNKKLIGTVLFSALIALIFTACPIPVGLANNIAFSDPESADYSGAGTLYVCTAQGDIPVSGLNTVHIGPPVEKATGKERSLLIYTPPGFENDISYPCLYLLHGFAARPVFWVRNLLPSIDSAITSGGLPPMIVIMPDGTIGGNGLDDPETDIDERGGCWYINSNLTGYEDFFLRELPEFAASIAQIDVSPGKTVIAGSSMGGFAAARYAVLYPGRFRNAALFYPALDLRYSVGGNPLAAYDEEKYEPVTSDRAQRIVNLKAGGGILGLTEKWCMYPVFDSDSVPGDVWQEDLPVWQRVRDVNPTDLLREMEAGALTDSRFFILTGDEDDFNFDDHIPVVIPLLERAGSDHYPADHIVAGGRHNWETISPSQDLFIQWLEECLSGE